MIEIIFELKEFRSQTVIGQFVELVVLSGAMFIGYRVYIKGDQVTKVIVEYQTKANAMVGSTIDAVSSLKIMQQVDFTLDTSMLKSNIQKSSTLSVINLSCIEKISVQQTGASDFPFFGILLPGKALFEFQMRFTGNVEYSTDDLIIEQLDNTIVITTGTPVINLTEIKFENTSESGNLNKQLLARTKAQQALDNVNNYPYYFSLFLQGMDNGEPVVNQILAAATSGIKNSITELISSVVNQSEAVVSGGVKYDIIVKTESPSPTFVTLKQANGVDYLITLKSIEVASIDSIQEGFEKLSGTSTTIKVENLQGKIKKVSFAELASNVNIN